MPDNAHHFVYTTVFLVDLLICVLQVPAEVNMKQEPQDEEFEEQLMTSSLQLAGKELAHMCLVVSH